MTQQPPRRPPSPPPPDLTAYRPYEERHGSPPPPIEERFRPARQMPPPSAAARVRVQPRRRRSWLRVIGWTVGGLGVLTAAALGALVMFAPVGMLREQLVREVEVRTGRTLAIAGRTSLSLYPSLGLTMGDVSLSAPRGMGGAPFVKMRQLDVRVAVMPLLSRKVSVEQLVLSEPVFELRVDQKGQRTWDFAAFSGPATIMVAQAGKQQGQGNTTLPPELQDFLRNSSQPGASPVPAAKPGGAQPSRSINVPDIVLGDIRIDSGTLRYRDERSGASEELRSINARINGQTLAAPIEAKGDLALRGDRVDFSSRIGSPKALLEHRTSRVSLAVRSARLSTTYEGTLSLAKGAELDGTLKLDSPSVRGLAAWLGARLSDGNGLGALSIEGNLKSSASRVAFDNSRALLDAIAGMGNVSVDLSGPRALLKADVKLGAVDLNPYLQAASGEPAPQPAAGAPAGPRVKGFTKRSGWSEAPIDLTAFGLLDADVRLSLASLVYGDVKVGAAQGNLTLKNRVLRTTIDDVALYDGRATGVITLEPSGQAAAVGANLSISGITALPLLRDVADFDWLDGKGRIQVAVAGAGANQRAIMETLNGKAEFTFTDGALIGFNLPQIIRGISQGRITGLSRSPTEKTDFSEAAASFQIRNGIAETKDLRASSPLLRLAGAGTVGLGPRQVDLILRPRLVGSLAGQGGAGDLSGLELPVKIKGPWERPQIGPDLDSLLKNPGKTVDTIREIGKQLQQGNTGGLNNLLEQFRRR